MLADLAVLIAVDEHLGGRYRAEAKGRRLAHRRFLEQQGGGADGHQIEEALVDLDREGRALEMAADALGDVLEIAAESRPAPRDRHHGPGRKPNHCDQGGVSSASRLAANCSTASGAVPSNSPSL